MESSQPRKFRATILKQGPNPYVDIPESISRAFEAWGKGGRISVAGTLNETEIQGTLIPVGKTGRHRLFINSAMRNLAAVSAGDTIRMEIRPVTYGKVDAPRDLSKALKSGGGAWSIFAKYPPSHKRELLRYIDEAKTAETRKKRIQTTVDHVLGKAAKARNGRSRKTLWSCPRCGKKFVNRNQVHPCGSYKIDDIFIGKPQPIRNLFDKFSRIVKSCGKSEMAIYNDRVTFLIRTRFAVAVPRNSWLEIALWLPRRIKSPGFYRVMTNRPDVHVHVLRIMELSQLDSQVVAWVKEARSNAK